MTALLIDGPEDAPLTLVLAHGAGAPMDSPFMAFVAGAVAESGVRAVRFEFPYMAARREGRRPRPDREPALLATWRDVVARLGDPARLVIGGKSMGGRMASMVADELGVAGLVCFGYPFHPPGRPERTRTAHLVELQTRALILQGTRDPFGNEEDVAGYELSPSIKGHWLEGGDHDFKPRAASGRTREQNWREAVAAAVGFLRDRWRDSFASPHALRFTPGMNVADLDTPCLLLDLAAMERNIATMAAFLADKPAKLRPHFKTPKTPEVARRQLEAGAIGITVAKLGEAEVLADAGLGPILMANQVVRRPKIDRLTALLARGVDITVAVESEFNVHELAEGARRAGVIAQAIIEVDSGMHRCGTAEPAETVVLARLLEESGVRYRGIMGYEGHTVHIDDFGERSGKAGLALGIVAQHAEALAEAGLPPEIVSVAGTGTYNIAASWPGVTEMQAGTYVFMDGRYKQVMPEPFECALTFLTTVLAVKETYAVCDAGMKSLSRDMGMPATPDGRIQVRGLSEEHAHLVGDGLAELRPGDRIELIPTHGDTTLNMHDVYYVRRGDEVIDTWSILAARKFR